VDENSQILVVIFISKLNFSFSFRLVDENCRIFVVVVFMTKINLFSSTKIFVFVVVDEKKHWTRGIPIVLRSVEVGVDCRFPQVSLYTVSQKRIPPNHQ